MCRPNVIQPLKNVSSTQREGQGQGEPLSGPVYGCRRLCRAVDYQLLTWHHPSNHWFLGDCTRQRASWDHRLDVKAERPQVALNPTPSYS